MYDKSIDQLIQGLNILVVDGNAYMRRVTRMMLVNLGARTVLEATDGLSALEAIRSCDPDVVFIDWDMPVLNGMEVMRIVRSPGVFPRPDIPIIMLTSRAYRPFVVEAMRTGVHEFLVKPTSPKALRERLMATMLKPRRMLRLGDYYVPEPRESRDVGRLPWAAALPALASGN